MIGMHSVLGHRSSHKEYIAESFLHIAGVSQQENLILGKKIKYFVFEFM